MSEEYHKNYHVTRAKECRQRKLIKFNELKDRPCTDCGIKFHYSIMEFDHIEKEKIAAVSWLVNNKSWDTVLKEIEKCELVCANCHRYRTWNRMQYQEDLAQ